MLAMLTNISAFLCVCLQFDPVKVEDTLWQSDIVVMRLYTKGIKL